MRRPLLLAGLGFVAACGSGVIVGEGGDSDQAGDSSGCAATELLEASCTDEIDNDCDFDLDCDDSDCSMTSWCIDPADDLDSDGLPNAWEIAAGDATLLDWQLSDTDDNGTPDSAEDFDDDGLTNLEEYALTRLSPAPAGPPPHPFRLDLLIELDAMTDLALSDSILAEAVGAYAAANVTNIDGTTGVGAHFYRDEEDIAPFTFDGSFGQRHAFLSNHGPIYTDSGAPPIPYDQFVHVAIVTERTDLVGRGGDAVPDYGGDIENTGVLIYSDTAYDTFPACGSSGLPEVTPEEALANTLVHEIGHTLQIGHDTEAGGGINYFNTMALPLLCADAQMRFHGWSNDDPALGNTEAVSAPRFSDAAAALMSFSDKLSVDTPSLNDVEM